VSQSLVTRLPLFDSPTYIPTERDKKSSNQFLRHFDIIPVSVTATEKFIIKINCYNYCFVITDNILGKEFLSCWEIQWVCLGYFTV